MGRGQRVGFRHTEEAKRRISEGAKGAGKGGFNKRVDCPLCQQQMNPANLAKHLPVCQESQGEKTPGHVKRAKVMRTRMRQYGLTVEQYDAMNTSQQGKCAICKSEPTRNRLSVDHCHASGQVRGLLCDRCNLMIGLAKDDPEVLQSAIEYVTLASVRMVTHP